MNTNSFVSFEKEMRTNSCFMTRRELNKAIKKCSRYFGSEWGKEAQALSTFLQDYAEIVPDYEQDEIDAYNYYL